MTSRTFDVETNGLLDKLTHIKCINIIDNETGEEMRFTDHEFYQDAYTGDLTDERTPRINNIAGGLRLLEVTDEICGHNICGFDIPAILKVYPSFRPPERIYDTAAVSRTFYTDIKDRDAESTRKGRFVMPGKFAMRPHSLAAWGVRLGGEQKGDFIPSDFGWTWENYPFSKECDDYCMQDVRTNVGLVKKLKQRQAEMGWPQASIDLEQDVAHILNRQQQYGWLYDVKAAEALTAVLQKEVIEVTEKLQDVFPPFYKKDGRVKCFKKAMVRKVRGKDYKEWCSGEYQPIKLTQFNPGSRDQITLMLERKYDWHPEKFTPAGKAQVDETVLSELPWPEAKACSEYFTVNKKLGQVSEGKTAQLKKVHKDGRMRGYVNHNGAVTGRMSHSGPNVAQTDKDKRIRSLYIVGPGKKLVGCDADGIEACCLGHYLALYDKGEYINVILAGDKKLATDTHSSNQKALGMNKRDEAKTIFYAWLYGSGDYNLGTLIYEDWDDEKQVRFNDRFKGQARNSRLSVIGRKARAALVGNIKGMSKLIKKVKEKAKYPGFVKGLDGRRVYTRSQHAALNTLLQSAGALIMKKALVLLDEQLQAGGLVPGIDYEHVANVHDELQIEAEEQYAEQIGRDAANAIKLAGEYFNMRCPFAGSYAIGDNWSETH